MFALRKLGNLGRPLAYVIAGHHAGLPDWSPVKGANAALESRLRESDEGLLDRAIASVPTKILEAAGISPTFSRFGGSQGLHLWIRMLFSCLVDADFLDTEAYMDPAKKDLRGQYPDIDMLRDLFNAHMDAKLRDAEPSEVNRVRADVLRQSRERAQCKPGLYTLTVPTGGGKTLSSLAFALDHAKRHGKCRVIYAIPYTSIIEQTADIFRGIFGDSVLEHHSNLDSEHETPESRLATENWDAPLVVTTNVQLFESLFAARTSRCRKLHNIVNSVIVLDEAQLLPPEFLQPILDSIRLLVEHYGVTLVLCTATQPALGTQSGSHGHTLLRGLDGAIEIVANADALHRKLERVRVTFPDDFNRRQSWDEIADQVAQRESVLAIVNTRADCRELYRRMPRGAFHLSALMCGEHRSVVIEKIKRMLQEREPVQVISTQLIEAGVDVDFPVVFRALAGVDSLAQAAGRCNREGKLHDKGKVVVFVPPQPAPKGLLRFGEDAAKLILCDRQTNPLSPDVFLRYFKEYYSMASQGGGLDKHGIVELLTANALECKIQFRSAADNFELIDNEDSVGVLVPYANPNEPKRDSRQLVERLRAGELHRGLLRQLQRYTVSVRLREFNRLRRNGELEELKPGLWVLRNETAYSDEFGLILEETSNPTPEKLFLG